MRTNGDGCGGEAVIDRGVQRWMRRNKRREERQNNKTKTM